MSSTGLTRRRFVFGTLAVGATTLVAACTSAPAAQVTAPTSSGTAQQAAPAAQATPASQAAPAAAAAGGQVAQLTVGLPADAPTLDPQKPGGPYGDDLRFNLFDSLAFYDSTGKVIPWLATAWTQVGDTQWRYTLRQGVKFSNGEDFDSTAVKYTVDRMLQPGAVRQLYTFSVLDHAAPVDKYTIDIFTKAPDPFLPSRMPNLNILPPAYTDQAGEDGFGQKPIGTGPFTLTQWLQNQQIELAANPNYWNGSPKVAKLIFSTIPDASTRLAQLLSGGVDIITDLTPEQAGSLKGNPRAQAATVQSKRVPYVGFNLLEGGPAPLKDQRVRQALNYAVDVDSIIKTVLGGYGQRLATIFRSDFPGYDASAQPYAYDPNHAKQLLADAGYSNGFSVDMQSSAGIIVKGLEISQAIVSQLGQVGVQVNLQPLDLNAYRAIVIGGQNQGKTAGLFLWNWGANPGDADSPLSGTIASDGVSSYYNDPTLNQQIVQARQSDDATARSIYQEIQTELKDKAPFIFLYQAADLYGVNTRINWKPRLDQYILGTEMSTA
jgi:peptide/nickel transport system substrate-binding protein